MAIAIAAFSVAAAAYALFRLRLTRREVRSLTRQLRSYNAGSTTGRITMTMPDRRLEALAAEMNRHTDLIAQAQAEQRRTEEELRQAVANISHDLRTPLTSISGYVQLLDTDGLTTDERRDAIQVIRKRTQRLQALLNDFYELAMIDSIDYALKPGRVRLDKLIPELMMNYYDLLAEKGLEPCFSLAESPIEAWADDSAVRRIIENLVGNALRHAKGTLDVRLVARDGSAILSLANDAPHLRGTNLELLFNRFYMADASRSGVSSGLGLSIARGLMIKMGGSLTATMDGDILRLACEWPTVDSG